MGRVVSVELAKRLRWEADGLVQVAVSRRTTRHPWSSVVSVELTRGRWDVMDLDITSPWFDTVPLHVVVELEEGRIKRRLDRDRLIRFGRQVAGVDPAAPSRPVTRSFLDDLLGLLGWSGLPGGRPAGGPAGGDGDDAPWELPDPGLL